MAFETREPHAIQDGLERKREWWRKLSSPKAEPGSREGRRERRRQRGKGGKKEERSRLSSGQCRSVSSFCCFPCDFDVGLDFERGHFLRAETQRGEREKKPTQLKFLFFVSPFVVCLVCCFDAQSAVGSVPNADGEGVPKPEKTRRSHFRGVHFWFCIVPPFFISCSM